MRVDLSRIKETMKRIFANDVLDKNKIIMLLPMEQGALELQLRQVCH